MGRRSRTIRRGVWLFLGALLGPPPAAVAAGPPAEPPPPAAVGLDDLVRLALDKNPALRHAGLDIDAARGRAVQAGLYPNLTVGVVGEEIGKQGGIYTLPLITQEIVTGGKLRLSRAAAERQVDQAFLAQVQQRFTLFTAVRQGYFESLSIQRRIEVLEQLIRLADQAYEGAQKLLDAKQIAELDALPFQVERDRLRGELDAARRELAAARRRLAATVGVADLPPAPLLGSLEAPLPAYDFEQARAFVLEEHPEIRSARVGVTRAQLTLRREEAEPIPNVTVGAGYQRNFNDRENQARYEVNVPLPLFNRNQGNIQAARAELARAVQEVDRVQNDVVRRLAAAFGEYDAARERAERYRTSILPNARKAYRLALEAFRGGQFEYLRVIQAQRAAAEADLEYVRLLGEAWRAAGEISGLLLEECWPTPPPPGQ
jgi:cobalt-zinc-cadmium efflux system outer membrane protein